MSQASLTVDREKYNNGYYAEQLKKGLEFQDYVTNILYDRGIVLVGYSSQKYQNKYGENKMGAEVKRDGKFRETGNLYIEVAEKAHPDNKHYVQAGVKREDNSWLFIIGDEKTLYVFATKRLREICERYRRVEKTTSIGYLLPVADANNECAMRIDI